MKYLLAILALLAVYLGYSYLRVLWVVQDGRNPEIRHSDVTMGTGPALKYMAAGDSTALGEGASSVEKTYAYRLAQRLAETSTVEYRNIAESGATLQEFLDKQVPQILAYQPDVVTISVGANDRTRFSPNNSIHTRYREILETLYESTKAKIYITDIPNFNGATLLPWPYVQVLEAQSAQLNPRLWRLENERIRVVNIHDFGWDEFPDLATAYAPDHFHPSDAGYENWTKAFLYRMR